MACEMVGRLVRLFFVLVAVSMVTFILMRAVPGDPGERTRMFQEAERILVEDVPGVFVDHETPVRLVKPWVRRAVLEPDKNGFTSIHWPGYTAMSTITA